MRSLFFISFIFLSCTSNNRSTDVTVDTSNKLALTDIKFLNRRVDLGSVSDDTLLTAKYSFVNIGNYPLFIDYVSPDCTCTGYYISQRRILPKDTAYILLKLATKNKYGNEKLFAVVSTNTLQRLYSLELLANIIER